jgi:hypothetical protein
MGVSRKLVAVPVYGGALTPDWCAARVRFGVVDHMHVSQIEQYDMIFFSP